MSRRPLTLVLSAVAAAALLLPATAGARQGADDPAGDDSSGGGGGSDVRVNGSCTRSSTAKLKLSTENGRIEVEWEVDQNRSGVVWTWRLARGGRTLVSGTATTRRPSGSFTVRRLVSNRAGRDTITATARRGTRESCRASATL